MRKPNASYVAVGVFVIAMLTAAIASLVAVTGRGEVTETYHAEFNNVAGLKFGSQVRYEGFPIGQVERITPHEGADGVMAFRVDLSVRQGWPVPADSIAAVASSGLLTAKTVDIRAGTSSERLSPGDTIAAAPTTDMFAVMAGVASEFSSLNRDGLRPLVDRVSALVERIGGTLERDLSHLIATLNASAEDIERASPEILAEVNRLTVSLNAAAASLNHVLSPDTMDAASQTVFNAELATLNLAAMSADLSTAAAQANDVIATIDALVATGAPTVEGSLDDTRYTLQVLTSNMDTIVHNLDGTARNMNEFSRMIRRNPGVLLNGTPPPEVAPATAQLPPAQ